MTAPSPVRVGLIGAGRWGAVHRDALDAAGAELAGVAVSSAASAKRVQAAWNVPATDRLDELFGWGMDAVIVASPNHLHARQAIAALDAGKHVLVEKPMAISEGDCRQVLAAAERSGCVLAVGHEMRVFKLFARVKEVLDAGRIGAPLHCDLRLLRRPHRAGSGGWKIDPEKVGSSILEEPIHYFDLVRWYLGETTTLQAWATSRSGREASWENLDVRLGFASGAQALVTRSLGGWGHHVSLDVVGERGALRARWDGARDVDPRPRVSLVVDGEQVDVPDRTGHAYDVPIQTRAFLAAVQGRGAVPADGEDGCAAVALCLAAERSLREGSALLQVA